MHGVGQALWRASCPHRPQRSAIGRYDQDFRFGAEDLRGLHSCDCSSVPATRPRHFDAHPYRNENEDGVWEFVRGCMRTYEALVEKAHHFDSLPEVREALAAASAGELGRLVQRRR